VPLHRYFLQAMDIMYANLKNGTAIPATPAAADAITFSGNTLAIPE
jgi:3HB-oligomer hydrolase 3HBOH